MFPRLVKRSFLLIVQIGVVLVILQHSHSSLLRSCFFFFFFFFVRAALMLQSQQFGGKQAVADFTDYFLPSDWRCRSPKSAALGFFFGSGNNKKNLPTHNAFKRDPKKKNWSSRDASTFFKGCLFPHCFIFFFLNKSLVTSLSVDNLFRKLNAPSNYSCHNSEHHDTFPSNKPQKCHKSVIPRQHLSCPPPLKLNAAH